MGTRTNFYKNPSLSYKKHLSLSSVLQNLRAYNVATGNAPPPPQPPSDDEKNVGEKRRRDPRPVSTPNRRIQDNKICDEDGPMSHYDYIQKRRKEVSFSHACEELTEDVLTKPNSAVNLVGYESDDNNTVDCEEKEDPSVSGHVDKLDGIKSRNEQRFPLPGEPVCLICGRYGEYICNETDNDICSMECKSELLRILKTNEEPSTAYAPCVSSVVPESSLAVPEFSDDTWDYNRNCWSKKRSNLCTYECWKCQRPGHLAEDCTVNAARTGSNSIPKELLKLYRRCHHIGGNLMAANCDECRSSVSLATCLDCNSVLCDNGGHLAEHIRAYPSHQQYYSHKLKRLVKCCKPSCKVTSIKDLLVCYHCFDKAFDKFYDMYTASWKGTGLSIIWGSICCEDHFTWHRMNCLNAGFEESACIIRRNGQKDKCIQLSDFIF